MTTTAPAPARSASPTSARVSVWTLASKEGWRVLRHPAFVLCAAFTGWFLYVDGTGDPTWSTQTYTVFTGFGFSFLPTGAAVAAGWVLTREHGHRDWFSGTPVDGVTRAKARLLALLWPTAFSALFALVVWLLVLVQGGITTGDALSLVEAPDAAIGLGQHDVVPSLITMAVVPAAVLMVSVCAYALASFARLAGTLVAGFLTLTTTIVYWAFGPLFWMTPLGQSGFEIEQPLAFDPNAVEPGTILLRDVRWSVFEIVPAVSAAHVAFLLGLTGMWAALALHRGRRHDLPDRQVTRRIRMLAMGSTAVAAAGIAGQLLLAPAGWNA